MRSCPRITFTARLRGPLTGHDRRPWDLAPGFVSSVVDVIWRTGMALVALALEMTEGILVQDSDRAMSVLSELKNSGSGSL